MKRTDALVSGRAVVAGQSVPTLSCVIRKIGRRWFPITRHGPATTGFMSWGAARAWFREAKKSTKEISK